jgi:voltage-gated sodium channel
MTTVSSLQQKVDDFMHQHWVQHTIVFLILLNAVLLGLETDPGVMEKYGDEIGLFDHYLLIVFVIETLLMIFAKGKKYWTDPWCLFDFVVIAIAVMPSSGDLYLLRPMRILRVLRLINRVESMKRVVSGLVSSISSLGSVVGLLLILFYVFAVISTNLFGSVFPELFGSLGHSFFTLFQVMTLESWSDGIARPIMEKFPYAWIFFVIFILIATFVVVNLFIAVIVDSFASLKDDEAPPPQGTSPDEIIVKREEFLAFQKELIEMKELITQLKRQ